MSELDLHPDVKAFKTFVEKHPQIIKEARSGEYDLKYFFKQYQKRGETDTFWHQYGINDKENDDKAEKDNKKSWTDQLKGLVSKIEFDQIDDHLKQADSAITELKKLLQHFTAMRGNKTGQTTPTQQSQPMQPPQQPMGGMNRRFF